MSEFYIRREGDEDAIGPYNFDQLSSLVEAKKLDSDAFFYNMETEEWEKISSNSDLMAKLYPKKRKLTLSKPKPKAPATPPTLPNEKDGNDEVADSTEPTPKTAPDTTPDAATADNQNLAAEGVDSKQDAAPTPKAVVPPKNSDSDKELSVHDMLAAAEGRHLEETKGQTPNEVKAKAAFLCLRLCMLFLFVSAAALAYIDLDTIKSADAIKILKSPFVLFAAADIIFALFLSLQVTTLYPLIRFRSAIGIGFFTMIFSSNGNTILLVANLLLMVGVYFATAVVHTTKTYLVALIGIAGIAAYAYSLAMPFITGS